MWTAIIFGVVGLTVGIVLGGIGGYIVASLMQAMPFTDS